MRIIETKVYEFDELNDKAKEQARNWYRGCALDYEWWDHIYEDAARIGLRITAFDLGRRNRIEGKLTEYVKVVCQLIMQEHGKSCDTYQLAEQWSALSTEEQDDNEADFKNALLEEYYAMLNQEFEYLLADEQVDEGIRVNGYTFTADGKREG